MRSRLNDLAARIRCCRALEEGKLLHREVAGSDGASIESTYLANLLVAMYGKLSSIVDAKAVFASTKERNVFSWTMVVAAFAQTGHYEEAVEHYYKMLLEEGKRIFEAISENPDLSCDTVVRNALITLHGKCSSVEEAVESFLSTPKPDLVTWNSVLSACSNRKDGGAAMKLFRSMLQRGVRPQAATLTCVLDSFSGQGECEQEADRIYERFVASGFVECDLLLGNSLISVYGKCRKIESARNILNTMPWRDVVSWTIMATAYNQNGLFLDGIKVLETMDLEGIKPDAVTFASVLDCCSNLHDLDRGRIVHDRVVASGFELGLVDLLVGLYGKCGSLEESKLVFDRAAGKNISVSSWNSMIGSYARLGHAREALRLFREMDLEGTKPDKLSFYAAFEACVSIRGLEEARSIDKSSGIEGDIGFESAVINLYSRVGSFDDAMAKFRSMPQRDVVSWNGIIAACNQHSRPADSIEFFRKMELEGFKIDETTLASVLDACASLPDPALGQILHERTIALGLELDPALVIGLINMYSGSGSGSGSVDKAMEIFESLPRKSVVVWTSMIAALSQLGLGIEALDLFKAMDLDGVRADKVTFSLVLDVCANTASLAQARVLHSSAAGTELEHDPVVKNTILNMYGKCGRLSEARSVFEQMPHQDVVAWTSIIAAYAQRGNAPEAFDLFRSMQQAGEAVDTVIFVKVMSGCSHSGMLQDAREWHLLMVGDYGICPVSENYACILDLLGRLGQLRDVEDLLENMSLEPDFVAWMSFLNACKVHKDMDRGVRAAERLVELDRKNPASYVLLSDINAVFVELVQGLLID